MLPKGDILLTLGEKIAVMRTSMRLSQEQLAERLQVSRQSVSKWESGKNAPDLNTLLRLSTLFDLTADELLRDEIPLSPTYIEPLFRPADTPDRKLKYFGTDGFRGEANVALTADHAYKIGRFLGWYYASPLSGGRKANKRAKVVVAKDTRRSSYMFEYALVAGLTASGADVYMLHVSTTPSVAYVVRQEDFDCGVMISASHNPFYDNGLKLVNSAGEKTEDATLQLIEQYLDGDLTGFETENGDLPLAKRERIGAITDYTAGRNRYVGYLISVAANSYRKLHIALDCANGAAWMIAPAVFSALGARVSVINDAPDGLNINLNAGSTHIGGLKKFVRENGCDAGFAFDGDADRLIAVDENGNEVNGDHIVFLLAEAMKKKGLLKGNRVVATVMSNLGFFKALAEAGIDCVQTTVGDRYVHDAMVEHDAAVGGEQTGHIILRKYASTGDGILTAIMVAEAMVESKQPLSALAAPVKMFPQTVKNVTVKNKSAVSADPQIREKIETLRTELGDSGRILLRESGTEPVVRIMAEATSRKICDTCAEEVAALINDLGYAWKG